jgi:hypothetical protein
MKERAALGFVQPTSFQSIPHSNKLEFADCTLQAEQEPVVGILWVVDTVLIGQDCSEDGTHLQKIVPIPVVAGDAAHLDPQNQADMLHGNFGQDAMKSAALDGCPSRLSLIVIDDHDVIPGPSQGDRELNKFILPFPRFPMIEDLLRIGLPHVNDGKTNEVEVQDL